MTFSSVRKVIKRYSLSVILVEICLFVRNVYLQFDSLQSIKSGYAMGGA